MKQFLLLPMLCAGTMLHNPALHQLTVKNIPYQTLNIAAPTQEGSNKMPAAVFKAQDYCRAELKDFEFEAGFKIISVVVYFSGAGFINVERGSITGSSLQPIKQLMNRCTPGSVITFDEVKVMGPDNQLRIIRGLSLLLT